MCNGNCTQGRQCDCVPNVDEPMEPVSLREALGMLAVVVLGAVLSIAGVCTVVGYLWQRFVA